MKFDKKLTQAAVLGLGLYLLFTSPLEVALVTFGIAAIVVGVTHQVEAAILVVAAPVIIKLVNQINEPFQVKDAPSIAKRLQEVKRPEPLAPKVNEPTGVLESPEIMSSENVVSMKELAAAVPASSIPAAAAAKLSIFTPDEKALPSSETRESGPLENPVLQNGPDLEAVLSALKNTGTAIAHGAADVMGIDGGQGVAGNAGDAF